MLLYTEELLRDLGFGALVDYLYEKRDFGLLDQVYYNNPSQGLASAPGLVLVGVPQKMWEELLQPEIHRLVRGIYTSTAAEAGYPPPSAQCYYIGFEKSPGKHFPSFR